MATEEPRRLHPVTPLFELIGNARQLAVPLFAALVGGQWYFALPLVVIAAVGGVAWYRFTYQVDGDVMRINEGVLVRKERTIAIDRIQQVDVIRKLRHRMLGVVELHVDTASGAKGAELTLKVVSNQEATRLLALLAAETTRAAADPVIALDPADAPTTVVAVSLAQLAISGITGAQTLVIVSLAVYLQEIVDVINVRRLADLAPNGTEAGPVAIATAVLALAVIWLGLAAAAQIFTHYGYRLTKSGDDFRVTRGLLDKREVGGSLLRVQAVRIEQSPIRRLLGFASVRIQTAALPGQSVSKIVIPYVSISDVGRVVAAIVPGTAAWPTIRKATRPALRLALFRRVAPTASIAVPVTALAFPTGAVALLAVPVAVAAAFLHWRALGYAARDGTLWARHGGLFRKTVVVPTAKAQSMRYSASPLQRRWSLASLRIDVAGKGSTPMLHDAPHDVVEAILGWVPIHAASDEHHVRVRARTSATGTF